MVGIILSYAFFIGIAVQMASLVLAFRVIVGWDTEHSAREVLTLYCIGAGTTIVSFFAHLFTAGI